VATVAILIVPVTMQIVSRFTGLIPSYIWTEELSRFLFIWMVMIGAMIAVREGTHFDVDCLARPVAARGRLAADRVDAVRAAVRAGIRLLGRAIRALRLAGRNRSWPNCRCRSSFMAWPVAGLTWLLFGGEAAAARLAHPVWQRARMTQPR
jgi:hypothetical protein